MQSTSLSAACWRQLANTSCGVAFVLAWLVGCPLIQGWGHQPLPRQLLGQGVGCACLRMNSLLMAFVVFPVNCSSLLIGCFLSLVAKLTIQHGLSWLLIPEICPSLKGLGYQKHCRVFFGRDSKTIPKD